MDVVDLGAAKMDATFLVTEVLVWIERLKPSHETFDSLSGLCDFWPFCVAQFGTAPDFNVTDIDGNQHQLYADILDQGLIAVIDVSATWCGPCWSLYTSNALEELHEAYGPDGTNQLRVIFYEGDPNTDDAALMGSGNTLGDWTGHTYPIVNESPLTLDLNIWALLVSQQSTWFAHLIMKLCLTRGTSFL